MSRRLMALNALFVAIATLCGAYIVRQLLVPMAMPLPWPRPVVRAPLSTPVEPPRSAPGAYAVVVGRNVFSPARTEGPSAVTPGFVASALRPNLYGVVLREGAPIAYLEDPMTRRIAGYHIGDAIAGGKVESIAADNVVILRGEGRTEVPLHDPLRARAAQPTPSPVPTQLPPIGTPPMPGTMLPGTAPEGAQGITPVPARPTPIPMVPAPLTPGATASPPTGRRSLLPNVLRRGVTPPPSDAPRQ